MNETALRAWRKAMRHQLVAKRLALPRDQIDGWRPSMDRYVERAFPNLARGKVAICWPFQNEYDARHVARRLRDRGAVIALPVVVAPRTPLVFREWHPGVAMAHGVYDIPFPADTAEIEPDSVLVPMNGCDAAGYRLGYGGGFFDRTLAALAKKPLTIGVTFEIARIETIHPQPYDIPMDFVVTERGVYERRDGTLEFLGAPDAGSGSKLASPPCYAEDVDPKYFGETD
ncbi:MAG: 5-formyltetrahydrofolate cyclo-ligase [Burkholderiales bacterium]|jgi:5,10-methenyltetrahydrofolate synthetase|nr:5-formyltetrahydrofolate cyclo-ligase [Burkholderiales bacterium]